jgi:hypothetical protein
MQFRMKHLSSDELLSRTKSLVAEERRAQVALIEHLEEIQRRRLYAELGFSSLWDFATRYLGLSEGAAQRRIQAMRLVREVPEAKAAIETGALSLSNAAKVQSFRQNERKLGRQSDAQALMEQVQGLTQRECERKLFEISPEALPRERERIVSAEAERELKIVISAELYEKLQRIRGLVAHSKPDANYATLLEYLADAELERLEEKRGIREKSEATPPTAAAAVNSGLSIPPLPAGKRVRLPLALRRTVWNRAQGRCEVISQGKRCASRHRLEIDHIVPIAQGGGHGFENLRLACWHHNQQLAWASGVARAG